MPTSAGGAGGRFFSVRRSGVTGNGRGGNDSPPVRPWAFAGGGGPQSTGPLPSCAQPIPGSAPTPPVAAMSAHHRAAASSMNPRLVTSNRFDRCLARAIGVTPHR